MWFPMYNTRVYKYAYTKFTYKNSPLSISKMLNTTYTIFLWLTSLGIVKFCGTRIESTEIASPYFYVTNIGAPMALLRRQFLCVVLRDVEVLLQSGCFLTVNWTGPEFKYNKIEHQQIVDCFGGVCMQIFQFVCGEPTNALKSAWVIH